LHEQRQQAALTHQWAKRVPEDKVKFYLCHPGWAETEGVKSSIPEFYSMLKVCTSRLSLCKRFRNCPGFYMVVFFGCT
jgi:hypothetical protein